MAAGYMKKILDESIPRIKNIEVKTAGVMTVAGLLATPEAVQIMDAVGVDLRKYRSTKLTPEMIKKADLILGMTPFHVQSALRMLPDARGKTFLLKEYTGSDVRHAQISDPMGCTLEVYKRVFGDIKSACDKLLKSEFILGRKRSEKRAHEAKKSKHPASKTIRAKSVSKSKAPGKTVKKKVH
jgi:protein-tyrosine-phosphatase